MSYLVQDDVILVKTAGVLGVGDHVVIRVLLPGTAAVAGTPGDRAQIADQIVQVSAWRDTEARHIAERVVQLNPRDRNTVTNLIDTLRAYDEQPRSSRRRRKPSTSDSA